MAEMNFEKINEFLQSDELKGHELILKSRCLETDARLREMVQEKAQIIEKINGLQVELNNKESDIVRTNGTQEGYIGMINDIVAQTEQGA